ncbi:MAG: YdcF family protein [Flavobacteriales bacterium]
MGALVTRAADAWVLAARLLRGAMIGLGLVAFLMILLAFTSVPFHAHRWLGLAGGTLSDPPGTIIVLGGSGMPSGPELLRLHCAAEVGAEHPGARLLVAHVADSAEVLLMRDELVRLGIAIERIDTALAGSNTREQALFIARNRPELLVQRTALVTAPENMYRSLGAFRKLGFQRIQGVPAFDNALFSDLAYRHERIGGKAYLPDVSDDLDLRYTFWNYLKLEITCLREAVALAYYRLNGWI